MNSKKVIKSLAVILSVMSLSILTSVKANAEWRKDNVGWWYAQGDSYLKNCWKTINGSWYHFNDTGYMDKDKIIEGYYINSNGVYSNGNDEVNAYINLLNNESMILQYNMHFKDDYYSNPCTDGECDIVDIDGNGIYEAIINNGTCHANAKTSILSYENGEIKLIGEVGERCIYDSNGKVLIASDTFMGHESGGIYKIKSGKLEQIHSFELIDVDLPTTKFVLDNENVTKEASNNFFKQYGEAGKAWIK